MTLKLTSGRIVFSWIFVTNSFFCGRMTIGVPGFGTDGQIGTDGQMDRQTEGQKIVIAGGERSVYRDSGWILSRNNFNCGRRMINVLGVGFFLPRIGFVFDLVDLRLRKIMTLKLTSGRIVFSWIFVTNSFYCGRMTIGVPGLGTDGQMDRQTEGQKIVIVGRERSVYWDLGWILS